MQGAIGAPKQAFGAFNILFEFIRDVELVRTDITVEMIEGDALGHTKDTFGGSGKAYHMLCYLSEGLYGKSRISVNKDGFEVTPVEISYDTVRTIIPTWGTPSQQGTAVDVPISLDTPIQRLHSRNVSISETMTYQIYGSNSDFTITVNAGSTNTFNVTVSGTVNKANGLQAEIQETTLEVDRGTLN